MNRLSAIRNLLTLSVALVAAVAGTACDGWFAIGLESGQAIASLAAVPMPVDPSWTKDGDSMVFGYRVRDRTIPGGVQHNLYVVNSAGSVVTEVTPRDAPQDEGTAFDFAPHVSPTSSKIVFSTLRHYEEDFPMDIAVSEVDGSRYRRLTEKISIALNPVWSPDGRRIAFISNLDRGRYRTYIMDSDGSNLRRASNDYYRRIGRLRWSPDGTHLAYRSGEFLYTVGASRNANFLGLTRTDPAWSPDGQWIAFSHREPIPESVETETIYVARPDGSDARKVIQVPADGGPLFFRNLSWSPDGSKLRFSFRTGLYQTCVLHEIDLDGSNLEEIAEVEWWSRIVWSPDGTTIAVSLMDGPRVGDGEELLYTMTSDGSDRRVLVRQGSDGPEAANGR